LSECERVGVANRELSTAAADLLEASKRAAVKPELRRSIRPAHDFDVAPQHAVRVAGAERFHRRFLGRKPAREVNLRKATAHAVLDLAFGEDPKREALAVAADRGSDSWNFGCVEPESDDVHSCTA
jgi:hypothetical protein